MLRPDPHLSLIEEVVIKYRKDPNVRSIFVSGSIARGEAGRFSDVDILLIGKKPRNYVRYYKRDIYIEVSSLCISDIPKCLRRDPINYRWLFELKALYDPENLLRVIRKRLNTFIRYYVTSHDTKGNLYIQLKSYQLKIRSALDQKDYERASFLTQIALGKCIDGLFAINNRIIAPPVYIFKEAKGLKKKPVLLSFLLRQITNGQSQQRIRSVIKLMNFLLPCLHHAMKRFSEYYKPWR